MQLANSHVVPSGEAVEEKARWYHQLTILMVAIAEVLAAQQQVRALHHRLPALGRTWEAPSTCEHIRAEVALAVVVAVVVVLAASVAVVVAASAWRARGVSPSDLGPTRWSWTRHPDRPACAWAKGRQ
jgi:hypothetical protein